MSIPRPSSRPNRQVLSILRSACVETLGLPSRSFRRSYASPSNPKWPITNVAVLGGGITGLASAYFLSRSLPNTPITLFEKSNRLGGWLHSTAIDVGTGQVVFENGPRTLRANIPNGLVTLDLIQDLGLEERLICTSKQSPAARNRYIYFPDHLVRMPGPGISFWKQLSNVYSEPVFDGLISGALLEAVRATKLDESADESIGSFVSRHFGSSVADNLVSAIIHGIYAGDINQLSIRSVMPRLWHTEQRYRSIVLGIAEGALGSALPMSVEDADLLALRRHDGVPRSDSIKAARKSSVFTFKQGLGELVDRMEKRLSGMPNVHIVRDFTMEQYKIIGEGIGARIALSEQLQNGEAPQEPQTFSHVISTLSSRHLSLAAPPDQPLEPLAESTAVTVMVVNLFYADTNLLPVRGFGYLLPRSIPLKQNPHRALGVVFDSESSLGQDSAHGTKLTIMFGGHWWQGFDSFPSDEEGVSMARSLLKQHLGIVEEPKASRVTMQFQCIPQYTVGHEERMAEASKSLKVYEGRLRVAGSSYTGVGVNDCIRAAKDVVNGLVNGTARTGLETFENGRKWLWVPPATLRNVQ